MADGWGSTELLTGSGTGMEDIDEILSSSANGVPTMEACTPVREQGHSAAILKQYATAIKKPMDVQTLADRTRPEPRESWNARGYDVAACGPRVSVRPSAF